MSEGQKDQIVSFPALTFDHRLDSRKALRLTQYVEMTGLDTPTFSEALVRLEATNDRFSQHFCGVPISKLSAMRGKNGQSIGASNRLFTLKIDSPTEQGTEFQDGVDPLGELAKLQSDELIHGTDNIVRYFRRAKDPKTG